MISVFRRLSLILCILCISCREQSNVSGFTDSNLTLTGKIENWKPEDGNTLYFLASRNWSSIFSAEFFFYHAKTEVSENGTFIFSNFSDPVDSMINQFGYDHYYHSNNNYGLLFDSIHPYLHNHGSRYLTLAGKYYFQSSYVYGGNSNKGYFAFLNPQNPVGTFSVVLEYVSKNYSTKFNVSEVRSDRIFQWKYDLNLKKGWNIVYIRQAAKTDSTMRIDINQTPPDDPVIWYKAMSEMIIFHDNLTGRNFYYR